MKPPLSNALHLRLVRAPSDDDRTVFFASVDRSIPLVPGVTIVGLDSAQIVAIMDAVRGTTVMARRRRYADGRLAVVIEQRKGA